MIEHHDRQRIKYICIDENCTNAVKLGCADCFLEQHCTHERAIASKFSSEIQERINEITNSDQSVQVITNSPQKEIVNAIEQEFEVCQRSIIERFTSLKQDFKCHLDFDIGKLREQYLEISETLKQQIFPLEEISQQSIIELPEEQLLRLIKFHQESPKLLCEYKKLGEKIQEEKMRFRNKKMKYLRKLKSVVSQLIKDFNENITPQKLGEEDTVGGKKKVMFSDERSPDQNTPQKQGVMPSTSLMMSGSSQQTQSPPSKVGISLLESARSGRRFPVAQPQKYTMPTVKKVKTCAEPIKD